MQVYSSLSCILYYIFGLNSLWSSCTSSKSIPLLKSSTSNLKARRVLVVAGNFSIDGDLVNIAQYDITTKE